MRESEKFEGRLSVVETVGRSLSGDGPSADLINLSRETADHLVSGTLKKATPVPITQAAFNALSRMGARRAAHPFHNPCPLHRQCGKRCGVSVL